MCLCVLHTKLLQIDLINRNVFLDKLYVSSEDQRNVLIKHLGWKNKKILNIPSLRFHKNKKKEFNGFIFPPYNLSKKNNYLERFEAYLKHHKQLSTCKI